MNLRDIETEIQAGLQNDKDRLNDATENIAYYDGDFDAYRGYTDRDTDTTRSAPFLQKIVKTLTSNLYRSPPSRAVQDNPEATAFLEGIYKDNFMFAKWQAADRLSTVAEVAAFQVAGTGDPNKPIKIHLWDASQFSVFLDPNDQATPVAVVTIDKFDQQRRYTLWTADTVEVFVTEKLLPLQTVGGTTAKRVSVDPNPYGILPFSFAHFEFPTMSFWSGGPGCNLREANQYINWRLCQSADNLRYLGRPIGVASGVSPEWVAPHNVQPGDFLSLPLTSVDALGEPLKPSLSYLQADTKFSDAEWQDLQNYVDLTLECHGIPPAAIRLVQNHARSGISIVAEQTPLLLYAKNRQQPFSAYEERLAKVVFQVAASHLGSQGVKVKALSKAAEDINLTLTWGELFQELPGPERDRADGWLLENKMVSKKMILMNRYGYSSDQAEKYMEQVAEDLKQEVDLGISGVPLQVTAPPEVAAAPDGEAQSLGNTIEANQT